MARILVIDDNQAVCYSIAQMLRGAGHVVETAMDGRAGVELFKAVAFDIVVTDILMPVMEGVETIRALRALRRPVRIIAMTGGGRMKNMDFLDIAEAFGADGSLEKPFRAQQLLDLVKRLLPPTT